MFPFRTNFFLKDYWLLWCNAGILARMTESDKADLNKHGYQFIQWVVPCPLSSNIPALDWALQVLACLLAGWLFAISTHLWRLFRLKMSMWLKLWRTSTLVNLTTLVFLLGLIPKWFGRLPPGGVTLLRAAAKNHARVTVVCDPDDYDKSVSGLSENSTWRQADESPFIVFSQSGQWNGRCWIRRHASSYSQIPGCQSKIFPCWPIFCSSLTLSNYSPGFQPYCRVWLCHLGLFPPGVCARGISASFALRHEPSSEACPTLHYSASASPEGSQWQSWIHQPLRCSQRLAAGAWAEVCSAAASCDLV